MLGPPDASVVGAASACMPHVARLECGSTRVDVQSGASAPIQWLAEFFEIATDCDSDPDYVIDLAIDRKAYESIRAEGPAVTAIDLDCFTKDDGFERHALWRSDGSVHLMHDDRARLFFEIDIRRRIVSLLAESDHRHARVTVMRIVRELVTSRGRRRGELLIHASGVAIEGCGVLMVGPKRSGKTSMLFNALARGGVGFLSNDRVILRSGPDGVRVGGQPTIVRTRPESLRYLRSPRESDWARSFSYALTGDEAGELDRHEVASDQTCFSMSPAQFCRWLEVDRVREVRLGGIVFPRIEPTIDAFELIPLDPESTSKRLFDNLFGSGEVPAAFADPDGEKKSGPRELRDTCARAATSCMGLECAIGPGAFRSPNVWPRIVRAIGGAP